MRKSRKEERKRKGIRNRTKIHTMRNTRDRENVKGKERQGWGGANDRRGGAKWHKV